MPFQATSNGLDRFVGVPWQDRGRGVGGVDCYGLCVMVYAELLGLILPSHADDYPDAGDAEAVEALIADGRELWVPVEAGTERPFDLILMHEQPWHLGLVVRRGLMLHMPEGKTSVIEQYTTGRHARRVEGLYRHSSRA